VNQIFTRQQWVIVLIALLALIALFVFVLLANDAG
jgi:hypothetical protein